MASGMVVVSEQPGVNLVSSRHICQFTTYLLVPILNLVFETGALYICNQTKSSVRSTSRVFRVFRVISLSLLVFWIFLLMQAGWILSSCVGKKLSFLLG